MDSSALPRHALEPEAVIAEAVGAVEPALDPAMVRGVVTATFPVGTQRRRLAALLQLDPTWLTQGRPQSPAIVDRFIQALIKHGATQVQPPSCGVCGEARRLVGMLPDSETRICGKCERVRRDKGNPCAVCGRPRFVTRDREGRPRCPAHPPDDGADPLEGLCRLVRRLCPDLPETVIAEAVRAVEPVGARQRKLLWALEDRPGLLTGDAAHGPPKTVSLIAALQERGAVGLVVPPCPLCGRDTPLSRTRDGVRCCAECKSAGRVETCARCGRDRPVLGRTHDGRPLCQACRYHNPVSHKICAQCGERRYIQAREGDLLLCQRCRAAQTATCSQCGEDHPCFYIPTGTPVCIPCIRKRRPREICVGCCRDNMVSYRTADGEPLCSSCGATHRPCTECGRTLRIHAVTADGAELCPTCWRKHPAHQQPCRACGTTAHLHHRGLCPDCAAHQQLREALSVDGSMRPAIEPVYDALMRRPGTSVLDWLKRRPARRDVLQALAQGRGPVTHQTLDALCPSKVVDNLRQHLVDGGVLPARDERLAALERWLPGKIAEVHEPESRNVLHAYITWHLLRRLRASSRRRPITQAQVHGVRAYVIQVVRLLNWLHGQGVALSSCTQDLLDVWLDDHPARGPRVHGFLVWTSRKGHTRQLIVDVSAAAFTGQLIAQDARWRLVDRLIHDEEVTVADKAAGLLALLFAQGPFRISALTAAHMELRGDEVALRLGKVPVQMPPPLDGYLRTLHAEAMARDTAAERWLFPGRFPAQHLSSGRLIKRLRLLGIHSRMARNTALIELASELPAVVVSRLLGIHQSTADTWQRLAGQDHTYAADITHRQ